MSQEESRTDLGLIRIHRNAIACVASLAALEIEGVKRITGTFRSSVMQLLGKNNSSAIRVEINKSEEVKVDIPLFIKYGFNIPDIANRVQENVRQALEKMTNLSIKEININVQGIERI
ncbi:MAG: Asp23/Gls24 family envelope stress response protein [Candidatus Omnitrophica bacterium]|nr:Asp23/Gls24 family envelope stress response protein [Candidatus Omnitrophota bacterium]